jgi:hypothetical protein
MGHYSEDAYLALVPAILIIHMTFSGLSEAYSCHSGWAPAYQIVSKTLLAAASAIRRVNGPKDD